MKKLLTIMVLLSTFQCFAQSEEDDPFMNPKPKAGTGADDPAYVDTIKFEFTNVVPVDSGIKQDELYSRAREWFAKNFNNSKYVLQMDDRTSGKLVGKGSIQVHDSYAINPDAGFVEFSINVYVKDGRYKYDLNNFVHTDKGALGAAGGSLSNEKPSSTFFIKLKWWRQIKEQSFMQAQALIQSLHASMTSKGSSDW
jgi:hypothetical protein